jgi:N-sulfoglucosamine sulfohydrolase
MASKNKNIVLLIADDLGKYVGCYGCKSLSTPHLDQLAADGTRFDMAFASTASCSGSRSTIYTGLHTHENGQYGLNMTRTHFQTWEHIDTIPKLFNEAGYQTGIIGKVHVGNEICYPWEIREESETRDTAWIADRCEAFFAKAKGEDRPFHLTVGFVDPHRDVQTRGEFGNHIEQYGDRLKLPEVKAEDVDIPPWISDLPETRQEFVEYYQAISRVDAGVGLIREALRKQGLEDETLFIFTSDNGPPFVNSKTTLYDAGILLPLIIRNPNAKTGVANPNMVSFIDLLPTMLDWAGLDPATKSSTGKISPPRLGHSILPIFESDTVQDASRWQDHIFGSHTFHELQNYWPTRFMRTHRYKYHRNVAWRLDFPFAGDLYASLSFEGIRNQEQKPVMIGNRPLKNYIFRPPEELYDLENDPHELRNLAEQPEQKDRLLEMRQKLSEWQKKTKDLWLYRDGNSVTMLSRYAKDGLEIPDRLDFDVQEPGTKGVKMTPLFTPGLAFSVRENS